MNNGIIIQCRDNATRYKEKSIRPFFEGRSIFEEIYHRLIVFGMVIVVATTKESVKTIEICEKNNFIYFVGDTNDVLKRFYNTTKKFNLDGVFRVCADNPFISTELFYPILAWSKDNYDYITFDNAMERHEGFWTEYISAKTLEELQLLVRNKQDREHVTTFIRKNLWLYKAKILPIPNVLNEVQIRLTVDTKSDFKLAQQLYPKFRNKWWMYIVNYIKEHPEIEKKMIKNIKMNPK